MKINEKFTVDMEYTAPMEKYIARIVRKWVDDYVKPHRHQYDEDWSEHKLIISDFKRLMVDLGFQRALFPIELGGLGLGTSDYAATVSYRMFEEVARGDSGMAVAFGVTFWPLTLICMKPHINEVLCREFAPLFQANEPVFAANLMTEPQGGSDIENIDLLKGSTIRTLARLENKHWIINGHKLWPTNTGGVAKLFGVVATTKKGSDDERDFAYIFVPTDIPGITNGKPYEKAGMAADKNSDVWLEDVKVPEHYRAWGPGLDAQYFRELITWGSLGSCAFATGVMVDVFEKLIEFVSMEKCCGKFLKDIDAISGEIANIASIVEISRAAGYQFARIVDNPSLYGERWGKTMTAIAREYKLRIVHNAIEVLDMALDLMGRFGIDREFDIEKHWRDIKMVQLWMGGKQLNQYEIGSWLLR